MARKKFDVCLVDGCNTEIQADERVCAKHAQLRDRVLLWNAGAAAGCPRCVAAVAAEPPYPPHVATCPNREKCRVEGCGSFNAAIRMTDSTGGFLCSTHFNEFEARERARLAVADVEKAKAPTDNDESELLEQRRGGGEDADQTATTIPGLVPDGLGNDDGAGSDRVVDENGKRASAPPEDETDPGPTLDELDYHLARASKSVALSLVSIAGDLAGALSKEAGQVDASAPSMRDRLTAIGNLSGLALEYDRLGDRAYIRGSGTRFTVPKMTAGSRAGNDAVVSAILAEVGAARARGEKPWGPITPAPAPDTQGQWPAPDVAE